MYEPYPAEKTLVRDQIPSLRKIIAEKVLSHCPMSITTTSLAKPDPHVVSAYFFGINPSA